MAFTVRINTAFAVVAVFSYGGRTIAINVAKVAYVVFSAKHSRRTLKMIPTAYTVTVKTGITHSFFHALLIKFADQTGSVSFVFYCITVWKRWGTTRVI